MHFLDYEQETLIDDCCNAVNINSRWVDRNYNTSQFFFFFWRPEIFHNNKDTGNAIMSQSSE